MVLEPDVLEKTYNAAVWALLSTGVVPQGDLLQFCICLGFSCLFSLLHIFNVVNDLK